jgi:hypothetical protein
MWGQWGGTNTIIDRKRSTPNDEDCVLLRAEQEAEEEHGGSRRLHPSEFKTLGRVSPGRSCLVAQR